MKQNTNQHNVEYYRRVAKKLKIEKQIPHHQALDLVAVSKGFRNWKHFLSSINENSVNSSSNDNTPVKPLNRYNNNDPYRNLLVGAVNRLLVEKRISLDLEGVNPEEENGYIFLKLFGYDSVILWDNIDHGELRVSVWWKYDHNKHPQANLEYNAKERFNGEDPLANRSLYKNFVGVTASCWLKRKRGKYIQGKNRESIFRIYTRKGELKMLKRIPIQKPIGFKASDPFIY